VGWLACYTQEEITEKAECDRHSDSKETKSVENTVINMDGLRTITMFHSIEWRAIVDGGSRVKLYFTTFIVE